MTAGRAGFTGTVLLLAFLLLAARPALAAPVTVKVAKSAVVNGASILLGDIAAIDGDDPAKTKWLKNLRLGAAAPPGGRIVLTRELIGMRLAAAGGDFTGVVFETPAAVVVTTGSKTLTAAQISDLVVAAIRREVGERAADGGEIVIRPPSFPRDLMLPDGDVACHVTFPYGVRYRFPTNATVDIAVDGRPYTKVKLRADVREYRRMVTAKADIAANTVLTAADLGYARMDTRDAQAGYLTDPRQAAGKTARRKISGGMILTESMLDRPLLIKRGGAVEILARGAGGVEARADGEALQDGRAGDSIRVKNRATRRIVTGRVKDEHTVEVA